MRFRCGWVLPSFLVVATAFSAQAGEITFHASSGHLAAAATFRTSGNDLIVVFTNTSASDVLVPADILTAVFFDVSGPMLSLHPASGSVVLNTGSTVFFGSWGAAGDVGGEWAFASGISGGSPNAAHYGISSAGFDLFGGANFPGANLQGPTSVAGLQYGLTSAGDNPATGNAPVTGGSALIRNSVVITLPGLPAGFDPSAQISNVWFQYGTALHEEPGFPGNTPEPSALALLTLGVVMLQRRRRRAAS